MSAPILPQERKFAMMVSLMDKVISSDVENTVEKMINKDPRLLCRLNTNNPEVKTAIKTAVKEGRVHPFDLLYEPEETFNLEGISKTQYDKENMPLTAEDAKWLDDLTDRFNKMSRKQALKNKKTREAKVEVA